MEVVGWIDLDQRKLGPLKQYEIAHNFIGFAFTFKDGLAVASLSITRGLVVCPLDLSLVRIYWRFQSSF